MARRVLAIFRQNLPQRIEIMSYKIRWSMCCVLQLNVEEILTVISSHECHMWDTCRQNPPTWWHHQMETFSALLAICAGNSPVSGEFPAQRPVTRSFDIFFDVRLIKRLSKHSRGWWFETLSHPLWRHPNEDSTYIFDIPLDSYDWGLGQVIRIASNRVLPLATVRYSLIF